MFTPSATIPPGAKALYYCHDSFGLGHLRRTLTLANHLRDTVPGVSQLIVTGSPVPNGFRFPDGADYIKLPTVTKDAASDYVVASLASALAPVREMRQDILFSAAQCFQPDFLIVDHTPAGLDGEAVKTLRYVKAALPRTKLIVGLRDVLDEAAVVHRSWTRDGVYQLLDEVYDLILVYGVRAFYDVVTEYSLSVRAAAKTRFVGYLERKPGLRSHDDVRAGLDLRSDKLVVVTGGGGDGEALYDAILGDLHLRGAGEFDYVIVEGPLLPEADRARRRAQFGGLRNVHFLHFTDDLPSYLGAADIVVSMGGYNATCEILSLGCPAIIVPRTKPRKEQFIRASILSERGLVKMVHPSELAPGRLLRETQALLSRPAAGRPLLPMNGLSNMVSEVGALLSPSDAGWAPLLPGAERFAEAAVLSA